jgi:transposase InsO family protein
VGNEVSPESLNYQLRKVSKNRSTFSTDEAIFKILYLAIRNASEKWTMPIKNWGLALNQFAIEARKRTGSVLMIFCQLHKKPDRPEVRQSVFMYVEAYYNRIRMHSALDYVAPNVFNRGQVA